MYVRNSTPASCKKSLISARFAISITTRTRTYTCLTRVNSSRWLQNPYEMSVPDVLGNNHRANRFHAHVTPIIQVNDIIARRIRRVSPRALFVVRRLGVKRSKIIISTTSIGDREKEIRLERTRVVARSSKTIFARIFEVARTRISFLDSLDYRSR